MDALVFLRDPLTTHLHEPDIQALLKVCDVHDVPVATNRASPSSCSGPWPGERAFRSGPGGPIGELLRRLVTGAEA